MSSNKQPPSTVAIFERTFWITIFLLIGVTLLLVLAPSFLSGNGRSLVQYGLGSEREQVPRTYEIQSEVLQRAIPRASQMSLEQIEIPVAAMLERVFAPVYAGIPAYTDFHYTVLGEYTELVGAVLVDSTSSIETMIFDGFDERLDGELADIDSRFTNSFSSNLSAVTQESLPPGVEIASLGPISATIIKDISDRAQYTVPLAGISSLGGASLAKLASQKIAAQLSAKLLVKSGIKATAKGAGVMAGVGTGALIGSAVGPVGSVVGGVVGAVATWLAVDKVIIEIDEYYNREEFESDLRTAIDLKRSELQASIMEGFVEKKQEIDGFTIRDL
ncbi:MAG: hypothetical protein V4751_04920 [Pseudomonadota bacterium]